MRKREEAIWNHYIDYLEEATHRGKQSIIESVAHMKKCIADGCSLEELKVMMLSEFEPITIMQSLEQWQNQMDLMLHTGLKQFNGASRAEHYTKNKGVSPYDFIIDGILDNHNPYTHIYNLSGITQGIIHMSSERGGSKAPELIKNVQKEAGLEDNYEIIMLLGDCYRQTGEFEKAIKTYEDLWHRNGHHDNSIQDAIIFTKYVMKRRPDLYGKQMEEWIDDYQGFKKQETIRRTKPKISRNDPCPCGSGKKYKYCCGKNK